MKASILKQLNKMHGEATELLSNIEEDLDKMQEKSDNASEKWHDTTKGEEHAYDIERLTDVVSSLEELIEALDNAIPGE